MSPQKVGDCLSCGEEMPRGECPQSWLACGHHCNCSWIHDCCHFCGAVFGEGGVIERYEPEIVRLRRGDATGDRP